MNSLSRLPLLPASSTGISCIREVVVVLLLVLFLFLEVCTQFIKLDIYHSIVFPRKVLSMMLRYPPSSITLTTADIDRAFRRLELRRTLEESRSDPATAPRLRTGPQRTYNSAVNRSDQRSASSVTLRGDSFDQHHEHYISKRLDRPVLELEALYVTKPRLKSLEYANTSDPGKITTAYVDPVTHLIRTVSTHLTMDGTADLSDARHDFPVQTPPASPRPYLGTAGQLGPQKSLGTCQSDTTEHNGLHKHHQISSPHVRARTQNGNERRLRSSTISHSMSSRSESSFGYPERGTRACPGQNIGGEASAFATFPRRIKPFEGQKVQSVHLLPLQVDSDHGLSGRILDLSLEHPKTSWPSRPPFNRLCSVSTPNLNGRTVSSDIIRSETEAFAPSNSSETFRLQQGSAKFTKRINGSAELLDLFSRDTMLLSPLERLGHDACAEYSSSLPVGSNPLKIPSVSHSFPLPSFGSVEEQESPEIAPYIPSTPRKRLSEQRTSGSQERIRNGAEALPTPIRLASLSLPPPDVSVFSVITDPERTSSQDSNTGIPVPDNIDNEGFHMCRPSISRRTVYTSTQVEASAAQSQRDRPSTYSIQRTLSRSSRVDAFARTDYQRKDYPILGTTRLRPVDDDVTRSRLPPVSTRSTRARATFPHGLDEFGMDDLSRYPALTSSSSAMPSARRSLPTSVTETTELGTQQRVEASRQVDRPRSHGSRPRVYAQHSNMGYSSGLLPLPVTSSPTMPHDPMLRPAPGPGSIVGQAGAERIRSFLQHDARMPPPPQPPSPRSVFPREASRAGGSRAMPARQRNQENDGSGEQAMMREELVGAARLRGGGRRGVVGHAATDESSAPTTAVGVVDDTPPREGRFERMMREDEGA